MNARIILSIWTSGKFYLTINIWLPPFHWLTQKKNLSYFLLIVSRSFYQGTWIDWFCGPIEVLIKVVAQAIPTYIMSLFKLPKELCQTIQSLIICFWWGHKQEKTKIHWINASCLCKSKDDGGQDFRDMETFNYALLAKQVWQLIKDGNSLVAHLLWAKYYPNGNLLNASLRSQPSFTWHWLIGARHVIVRGSRWLVRDGHALR